MSISDRSCHTFDRSEFFGELILLNSVNVSGRDIVQPVSVKIHAATLTLTITEPPVAQDLASVRAPVVFPDAVAQ